MSVRKSGGKIALYRTDRPMEKELDSKYLRIGPREWLDLPIEQYIGKFKNMYAGKAAYIIGKGPSIVNLKKKTFEPGCPVIALNEAFTFMDKLELEGLYGCQQDANPGDTLSSKSGAVGFAGPNAWPKYKASTNVVLYNPSFFGLTANSLTAMVALHLAKYMGCVEYRMLGFDSVITGDCSYAAGIKSHTADDPKRFVRYAAILRGFSPSVIFQEWKETVCTPEPLRGHLPEHHEQTDSQSHSTYTESPSVDQEKGIPLP